MNMSRSVFVAVTVARSRPNFYFSQRLRQQKTIGRHVHLSRGMLHKATIRATCVATKLRDKLQEKLPSVTAAIDTYKWFHCTSKVTIKKTGLLFLGLH